MIAENIRTFLEVCEAKNMSVAAENLFLTQSSVSRQIRSLEKEMGTTLFERGKGQQSVVLTPSAKRLLPIARQLLFLEEEALAIRKEGVTAQFSIAAPESLANYRLAAFFSEMASRHNDWDITLSVLDSRPICDMVLEGRLDAGIINAEELYAQLHATEIFTEPFVVVRKEIPPKQSVTLNELDPRGEVYYQCGSMFNAWHNHFWEPWQGKMKVNLAAMAVHCLTNAQDWTMLPVSAAKRLAPDSRCIQCLSENEPHRTVYYIYHKGLPRDRHERILQVQEEILAYLKNK